MANFIKHVGKVGDRKVAIIFRQLPGDEHMCLVVYTETLNRNIHDSLIRAIESAEGQAADSLADVLHKSYTLDGKIILNVLHHESMLKRIQTDQVIMTPTPNAKSHVRLNELNALLNEMAKGDEAIKRLAEIDASSGLQDPKDVMARKIRDQAASSASASTPGTLSDTALANNLRTQAAKMSAEAKGLLAEAERLMTEANQLEQVNIATEQAVTKVKRTRTSKVKAVA